MLFQEQILRIARDVAGLSWAEADRLRKGMSKFQGDEIRVSSKKRDDLQAAIALLKGADLDVALQFVNYR